MPSAAACCRMPSTYIEAHGGKVVGDEYQPMDAGDWTAIISKVRSRQP